MINAFPVLYGEAYHQLLRECGRQDGLTFSRAGYAGSQRCPAHWAGDENSTWEAFRHSIVAGLSAGASGIPFWGWDIAGFSGEIPSGELYRRAWMMATFCPIMQYHSEYNAGREPSRDRTPWNIAERTADADVLPVCRFYTAVRHRLRPYILREAEHTVRTGQPLMCALPLSYPSDPQVHAYPYQYLFGRDLLVAPTVYEGATSQEVYLPAGMWYDLWTRTPIAGPCIMTVEVPPNRIPVYVRVGAGAPLDMPWGEMTTNA
jgi:alpha-glucosidase (family GH31 glycosyl hydrolase)